jgi:regulator of replication initiation timing
MKALVGSWDNRPPRVLAELTALRTRVAELTRELQALRQENADLRALLARTSEVAIDTEDAVLSSR